MLRVGKQKRTAMKIVECVPIVLCGCTQESIPEATPALVPRTQRSCPAEWCTSRDFWFGWTRAQLTTAGSRAG